MPMKTLTQWTSGALCVLGLVVPAAAAAPSSTAPVEVSSKPAPATPTEVSADAEEEAKLREGHSYHGY